MSELWNLNKVMITGAAGTIGSVLREGLKGKYETLVLSDIAPLGEAAAGEQLFDAIIQLRVPGSGDVMVDISKSQAFGRRRRMHAGNLRDLAKNLLRDLAAGQLYALAQAPEPEPGANRPFTWIRSNIVILQRELLRFFCANGLHEAGERFDKFVR